MGVLPEYAKAREVFAASHLDVSRETFQQLAVYADFLVEYNQHVNLTAVTDGEEILKKHFIDSFLLQQLAGDCIPAAANVLDIGSGAGFPGVPLALLRPDLNITLLDSLQKRIVFLDALKALLHCTYTTIHARAEELAKTPAFRETFDVVTARAVAALPVLAEISLPYVRPGGYWIAMKGPNEPVQPALQAIRVLGGTLTDQIPYTLTGGDKRVLYVVKKISPCPTKYPRKIAQIKQKPL